MRQLEAGDALLLFTDGAVEIMNAQDEELGEAGLRALLKEAGFAAGGEGLESLERRLLAYSNLIRLPDDLTLLSMHRPAASPSRPRGG